MIAGAIPTFKVPSVWASSAAGSLVVIPPNTVPSGAGHMSWEQGIPPECMTFGGIAPFGAEQNGYEQVISAWVQWMNAGACIPYDLAFCDAIGGYPFGALVWTETPGQFYVSNADNNTQVPPGSQWTVSRLVPAFTQLPPAITRVHGVSVGANYNNSITVSGVAPIGGYFVVDAYVNYYSASISVGQIVANLTNSINGTSDADGCQVSQYHRIIVQASAGQTMTATLTIAGSSDLSPSTDASYAVSFIFQPFF